jgi:hypothetical protein
MSSNWHVAQLNQTVRLVVTHPSIKEVKDRIETGAPIRKRVKRIPTPNGFDVELVDLLQTGAIGLTPDSSLALNPSLLHWIAARYGYLLAKGPNDGASLSGDARAYTFHNATALSEAV